MTSVPRAHPPSRPVAKSEGARADSERDFGKTAYCFVHYGSLFRAKHAIEGELCLKYEMDPYGVKVSLIERH